MRGNYKNIPVMIFFIYFVFFCGSCSAAAVNDDFQAATRITSGYFNIQIQGGVDLRDLVMKISVPAAIAAIIKEPVSVNFSSANIADQLDLLFLAVSEILDIHLTKFKCDVKICKDSPALSAVAEKLFGREIESGGFYVSDTDTLYVDAENITIHILGHEMSHAIQTHYFVVAPPVKIQEILAGYVEFQLRKYSNTLPK